MGSTLSAHSKRPKGTKGVQPGPRGSSLHDQPNAVASHKDVVPRSPGAKPAVQASSTPDPAAMPVNKADKGPPAAARALAPASAQEAAAELQPLKGDGLKRGPARLSNVFSSGAESRWRERKRTVRVVKGKAETSLTGRDLPRSLSEQVSMAPATFEMTLYVNGAWLPFQFTRLAGDNVHGDTALLRYVQPVSHARPATKVALGTMLGD